METALSLYNQCEYEKAYDILSNLQYVDGRDRKLFEECKKQILQQYIYLIKEAETKGDITKANLLKSRYTEKYGRNEFISEPKDDNHFLVNCIFIPLCLIICIFIAIIMIFSFN